MTLRLASKISSGSHGPDVSAVHEALARLGRSVPVSERTSRVYGPGTAEAVRALQDELGVAVTGVVDDATVKVANARLSSLGDSERVVRGTVRLATGAAPRADGLAVNVWYRDRGAEQLAGQSRVESDGGFEIRYRLSAEAKKRRRVDLRVEVTRITAAGASARLETRPDGRAILQQADQLEVIDFVVLQRDEQPSSEYDQIAGDLKGETVLERLGSDDLHLLADELSYPSTRVAAMAAARRLAGETGLPEQVHYALIRQGLPADLSALLGVDPDARTAGLEQAIAAGIVPATVGTRKTVDYLNDLPARAITLADKAPVDGASSMRDLVRLVLTDAEADDVLGRYARAATTEAFWTDMSGHAKAAALRQVVEFGGLTNNHLPLVKALAGRRLSSTADLAALPMAEWHRLLEQAGTPADAPGATADEQSASYCDAILARVESAFPRAFFAARLQDAGGSASLVQFLQSRADFDLKTSELSRYLRDHRDASLGADDAAALRTFQRVLKVTGTAADAIAVAPHARSAHEIVTLGPKALTRKVPGLSETRAKDIHDRARQVNAAALALWGEHAAGLNQTDMAALPRPDSEAILKAAVGDAQEPGPIPDWESLFGRFELCACQECNSVLSPAAYFVDLLQFLDAREALPRLLERRPDLAEIELSCENSHTPVPYVDLVNEVLENLVAPPPPFVATTLAGVTSADLEGPLATDALRNAFTPPLQAAAAIETLVSGSSWRVLDTQFAYHVMLDAGTFTAVTRSRQTSGTADDRRAFPQYRNDAAYDVLSGAFFPWTLPFDRPLADARTIFEHFGIARHRLIGALRGPAATAAMTPAVSLRWATSSLGLSAQDRRLIVGQAATSRADFWGAARADTVRQVLDGSGLTFAELEAVLATGFVNPDGSVGIEPADSCDTTALTIANLTDDVLSRLHRFVRLWRAVDWTIDDLDKVMKATGPDLGDETLVAVARIVELQQTLRLPVLEVLALWHPLDTSGASLYGRVFQDEKFPKAVREAFRLRADGQELQTPSAATSQAATLQAVLRLRAPWVDALIAMTDGSLTLANLSSLFRRARLMQALSLSPDDLSAAIALTGIDPFAGAADTGRFIAAVTAVRESGFTWRELDYLLRHRFQSPAPIVPSDDRLAAALSEIRAGLLAIAPANAAADRALVFERLAATLALPEIAVGTLMGGRPEMDALIALRELAPDEALSRANASAELDLLRKLTKIALIVTRLSLPGDAWRRVAGPDAWIDLWNLPMADTDASPLSFDAWFQLVQFRQLRRALETTDGALESILRDQAAIAQAPDDATRATAKAAFVSSLVEWLGWTSNDVQALIGVGIADQGILGVSTPADYRGPALLLRMAGAIAIVKTLGVAVTKANGWCDDSFTADHAAEVRAAAVARHDEQTWRQIARPLQDRLRNAQRTALVDYLVARPALWRPAGATDPADRDDLYARLLIDVEMDACQLTSRLVQATGSAQLFGQRCLMGLEGVATDDEQWRQWQWMKNYRVWEANRKIWLYPENWIRPELRDGKSPFFEELEQELLQEEITDATAEAAVRRYLEKLDQVGRLEIVGLYEDDETHVLHVFGRTFNSPRVYFHRQAVITESSPRRFSRWTPWRKVDLEIEGDHLIPVVRNRRLTLIWPVFTEKQDQKPVRMPEAGGTIAAADKYWDLHLAWSEYRDGRWSATNVSEDVALRAYQGRNDVLFGTEVRSPGLATNVVFRCNDPENMGCPPPDPSDDNTPPPPTTGSSGTSGGGSSTPASLPLIDKRLISFKAFVGGDSLTVRGYISLAYATPSDPEVAAAFGEFRFAGCRDIVTAFPRSYIESRALPVAPAGTRWDAMGFDQRSGSLTLMDGDFPVHHDLMAGVAAQDNRSGSLFGGLPTAAATKASRIDIQIFRATPSHYRLLAPHQDLQFKGDRPFAFMDRDHTLLALSDGASGFRPDFRDWVVGDLSGVWTAAYFGTRTTTAPSTSVDAAPEPLLVLARGADGRRIARQIVTADIAARPVPVRIFPRFWTTRRYRFVPFAHPFTCELEATLDRASLRGLLSLETQEQTASFFERFDPIPERVQEPPAPVDAIDFERDGAYELYNWELFFHVPTLIADRLAQNQRFDEALRWYHFVFDPTSSSGGDAPQRYWRTLPFNRRLQRGPGQDSYEAQSVSAIEQALAGGAPSGWLAAVDEWRANPFKPHAVARLRTTAYQKYVVMSYLDTLIACGDQLFRQETLEALNEAAQMYVLAAEILGGRPESITRRQSARRLETYASITADSSIGPLSNIEQLIPDNAGTGVAGDESETPAAPSSSSLYFCVPENDKLVGYWATAADRLFKLRHCMDIEGRVRQLPLFAPPIDPALLVRAAAAGLGPADVLQAISDAPSHYRFPVMLSKAQELAAETRALGAALLSALERRDGESLSLLRAGQEVTLLSAVRDSRTKQVDEAKEQVLALQASRKTAETRQQYFESREFQNAEETLSQTLSAGTLDMMSTSAALRYLAGKFAAIGALKLGSPTTSGLEVGPDYAARSLEADAGAIDSRANRKSVEAQRAARSGEFRRRQDEWTLQAALAAIEIAQIDRQLAAAEIRLAMAERELETHDLQTDQAREAQELLRDKFTNADLFSWMIGQTSALYFQTYQLAFDIARRAERCLQRELGEPDGATSYIQFGAWDSLKKGLLAGEHLAHDLRRLELAALDKTSREYELTRHVSLAAIDPLALIALKATGRCDDVRLPEALFDLDTPGHYQRRIKSVSVTIPCVTGPYTGVHCTLRLVSNAIRWDRTAPTDPSGYARLPDDDPRFIVDRGVREAIVTSSAQQDAGLFEANLRDERYLPFEGAGAISTWSLVLPSDFRSFDYQSISDVILHVRYTARDGGDALANAAAAATRTLVSQGVLAGESGALPAQPLSRLVSLRHEFPSEWHRFVSANGSGPRAMTVDIAQSRFPYFAQSRQIAIKRAAVFALAGDDGAGPVHIAPGEDEAAATSGSWEGNTAPGPWTIAAPQTAAGLQDVFVVMEYGAS